MASTYTPIGTYTATSAQSSITLSSLGGYTDLVVAMQLIPTTGCTGYFRVNGSSSAIYSDTWIVGYGSGSPASYRDSNQDKCIIGDMTGTTTSIINLQNYSNTTTYKTFIARSSSTGNGVAANAGMYRDTAAITSITIIPNGTTWATGTTVTVYGIASA